MKKLMKFENSNIQMIQVDGVWYFELYSVGMALGQVRTAKGRIYPRKDRINENAKNAEIKPVVRNGQPFITEEQIYDLMLETRTDKCRVFRKWLTNEVLPELNHTGTYTMKQEAKPDKPYEYIEKTYNGVPVLTSADVEYFTKIRYSTIDWYFRFKCIKDSDYYYITGDELKKYKIENPRVSRLSSVLYLITREGFIKFCRAYGIKIETPKCFEVKEQQEISAVKRIYDAFCKYYDIKRYRLTEDVADVLDCGKNGLVNESCIVKRGNRYQMFSDDTAPLLERQFMVAQNLGRILAGQLRENANPDIKYEQDARTFAMVVMALSLYFDN